MKLEKITTRRLYDNMITLYQNLACKPVDMPKRWFFQICSAIFYTIYLNLKQEIKEELKNEIGN